MDKSLVSKATSADEVPTPGYMFNEIARITHASSDACHQLEAFLLKRLNKDNVHQKYKVLKVMKHCCTHGHMTFRRDMQRETTAIKACLSYRGTPDPMHGDTLNKAVRDMAQEVMNAVFDTSTASEQLHSAGRMQGFGSEGGGGGGGGGGFQGGGFQGGGGGGFQGGGGGAGNPWAAGGGGGGGGGGGFQQPGLPAKVETGAYSTGRMQGFGNPNFDSKPAEPSKVQAFASMAAGSLKEGMSKIQAKVSGAAEGYASHGSAFGGGRCGGGAVGSSFNPAADRPSYGGAGGFNPSQGTYKVSAAGGHGAGAFGGGGGGFQPP